MGGYPKSGLVSLKSQTQCNKCYIFSKASLRSAVRLRNDKTHAVPWAPVWTKIVSEPSYKNCAPTGDQLSDTDLQFLVRKTRFNKKIILSWFKNFRSECPNGKLSWSHLYGEQNDRMTTSKVKRNWWGLWKLAQELQSWKKIADFFL